MKASLILVTWAETDFRMKLLKETLESLREHTHYPHELIIVDNGPKQQTRFLLKQEINKHIINEINVGIGPAFNQGIEEASGDYISFLANDLRFEKDWLSDSIEALEKYPDKKLIATTFKSTHQTRCRKRYFIGNLDEYSLWFRSSPAGWVMRKDALNDIGLWPDDNRPGTLYCNRITKKGYRWISPPERKVFHVGNRKPSYNWKNKLVDGKWVKR